MDEADRETIHENLTNLVRYTSYNELVARCLEERLLFDVMVQKIERLKLTERERHRELFIKLTKRGPDAYRILHLICNHDFAEAGRILGKSVSLQGSRQPDYPVQLRPRVATSQQQTSTARRPHNAADHIALEEFTKEVTPIAFTTVKKSERFHVGAMQCYPMRTLNRGVAFIVNLLEFTSSPLRNGGDKDKVNLVALFRQMGFTVMYYENISSEKLFSLIRELKLSHWLRDTECFVFTLMSHGSMVKGVAKVEFTDGSYVDVETILAKFNNTNCPKLIKKPKVFLLPFCRGNVPEKNLNLSRISISNNIESDSIHTAVGRTTSGDGDPDNFGQFSDVKICYATSPGFKANRQPESGSWYIESFCKILAEHAHDKHLEELLKLVGEHTGNWQTSDGDIQTPGNEDRGFTKTLYFNPGLCE